MADPAENSVGYYAKEALVNLGLWEKVKPKLKLHWHAKTAVEYVCSARVDAGVYYRACPFDTAPEKVENQTWKFAGDIPQEMYPKVRIQAGTLKEASHRELARQFVEYLLTDAAQKLLDEKGIPNYKE
jgi:molybdate transport system substrate-binding protein